MTDTVSKQRAYAVALQAAEVVSKQRAYAVALQAAEVISKQRVYVVALLLPAPDSGYTWLIC